MLDQRLFQGHHTKKQFGFSFLGLVSPITPHSEQVCRVRGKLGSFKNWPPSHFHDTSFSLLLSLLVLFIYCYVYLLAKEIRFPYNSPSGVGQIFTNLDQRNYPQAPSNLESNSQVRAAFPKPQLRPDLRCFSSREMIPSPAFDGALFNRCDRCCWFAHSTPIPYSILPCPLSSCKQEKLHSAFLLALEASVGSGWGWGWMQFCRPASKTVMVPLRGKWFFFPTDGRNEAGINSSYLFPAECRYAWRYSYYPAIRNHKGIRVEIETKLGSLMSLLRYCSPIDLVWMSWMAYLPISCCVTKKKKIIRARNIRSPVTG